MERDTSVALSSESKETHPYAQATRGLLGEIIKAGTGALTNVKVVTIRHREKSSDCSPGRAAQKAVPGVKIRKGKKIFMKCRITYWKEPFGEMSGPHTCKDCKLELCCV